MQSINFRIITSVWGNLRPHSRGPRPPFWQKIRPIFSRVNLCTEPQSPAQLSLPLSSSLQSSKVALAEYSSLSPLCSTFLNPSSVWIPTHFISLQVCFPKSPDPIELKTCIKK